VSVVVPAFNAARSISEQLSALASQDYPGEIEVVVADNGSTDGTGDIVRAYASSMPGLRLVRAAGRQGAAHARNVGTRAATGEIIAYADADDRVRPDWLRHHVEALGTKAFVAGRMDQASLVNQGRHSASRAFAWTCLPVNHDFLPWGFGGNLSIRRPAFEASGGWDESYPAVNDVPFCWRVQLAGYPLSYEPDAVVEYRARESLRGLMRQHRNFGRQNARLYRDFRIHGARCGGPAVAVRRWASLVVRTPELVLGPPAARATWLKRLAFRLGCIEGSVRSRVLCL
jgi:glycosyltransferase involved in cell wall biosynthesis